MTLRDLLLDHLDHTFEKEAWQPSLVMAVEGIDAAAAGWRPAPQRHSIWQIVRHVTHWKRAVLEAWEGRSPDFEALERSDWQEVSGDDPAWQEDVRALREVSERIKERVQALDDAALSSAIITYAGFPDQPAAIRLARMATHDSYHAGQIQYIRALRGA
jgi:uncharacterized damage-inducible protein DinB